MSITPLSRAINGNYIDAVRCLINSGANINQRFNGDPHRRVYGNIDYPICLAGYLYQMDIFTLLIDSGANLDAISKCGFMDTIYHYDLVNVAKVLHLNNVQIIYNKDGLISLDHPKYSVMQ